MTPSPKNHDVTSTAEAIAAGQDKHDKSPQSKLVLFFAKSRDAWKTQCLEAKTAVKSLKNTVRFLESSKAHWKRRVKALERALAQLQARERDREGEIALLKKDCRTRHSDSKACGRLPAYGPLTHLYGGPREAVCDTRLRRRHQLTRCKPGDGAHPGCVPPPVGDAFLVYRSALAAALRLL